LATSGPRRPFQRFSPSSGVENKRWAFPLTAQEEFEPGLDLMLFVEEALALGEGSYGRRSMPFQRWLLAKPVSKSSVRTAAIVSSALTWA
jgi:hypothetical protein